MKIRKFLLIFIGALLGLCFLVSFSYAYYTGNNSVSNSTNVTAKAFGDYVLIDQSALTISGDKAVPISDAKALSSSNYLNQFQIRNDSKTTKIFAIYIVPLTSSSMNSTAVKYALYESNATKPTSGISLSTSYNLTTEETSLITAKGYTPGTKKYSLLSVTIPANTTKTYNLYMWINYTEAGTDNATMQQNFQGVILLENDAKTKASLLSTDFASSSSYNSVINLVERQGVNTSGVHSIYFVDMNDKAPTSGTNVASFIGTDESQISSWVEGNNLYFGAYGFVFPGPSMAGAFYNMQNLKTLDLSAMDASYVNNMSYMFYEVGKANNSFSIKLGNQFNTSNVTNMSQMFVNSGRNSSYFTLNLGEHFNTSNVTKMTSMFFETGYNAPNFNLKLGNNFNTEKVTDMYAMFYGTGANSTALRLSLGNKFNTINVSGSMAYMFSYVGHKTNNFNLNLGNHFHTSKVTDMTSMFFQTGYNDPNFTINLGNNFNTSKVTKMAQMFEGTGYKSSIFTLNLGNKFNTTNVTNMIRIFRTTGYSSTNFELNLGSYFNTHKITIMNQMFEGAGYNSTSFTLDLGPLFNTKNVTNMMKMFLNTGVSAKNFTLKLGPQFNTSKVTDMQGMFYFTGQKCSNFTINLGNQFNTSNVTNMSYMFSYAGQYSNKLSLNLGNEFNTSNVTTMRSMFDGTGMFGTNFTLDLGSKFNTSKVTDMYAMFYGISNRSTWTLNLKSFDFGNVTNSTSFFSNRYTTYPLTVLCSTTNGDFINSKVGTYVGYNVVCS